MHDDRRNRTLSMTAMACLDSGVLADASDDAVVVAESRQSLTTGSSVSTIDREATADDADSSKISRKPRKQKSKSSRKLGVPLSADLGVMHLCDFTECKLPAEDWYLASKSRRT